MKSKTLYWGLLLLLPVLFLLELNSGPVAISLLQGLKDLLQNNTSIDQIILLELRLPRALLAMLVGASLGISGAALQGLLRNPLASPDILGISQTAALFAVVVLYFGIASMAWYLLPLAAIAGATLAVLLMLLLTRKFRNMQIIILAGIAISAIAASLSAFALNFAPNPYALQEIYYWMLGSVANRSLQELGLALPFMLIGIVILLRSRYFLDALTLGEDSAQSLGFNVQRNFRLLIPGVACCIGAAVAVSGNIGFVGLIVPHLLRPFVGGRPGALLWLSLPGGAAMVLLADILIQQIPGQQELQLGVLTAAFGGPFFLYLLFNNKRLFA